MSFAFNFAPSVVYLVTAESQSGVEDADYMDTSISE
jgi:hypothetical protein